MLISASGEATPENLQLSGDAKSSNLMESKHDSFNGSQSVSESSDSPSAPTSCTDVNVVPEHRKSLLEQSILNLESELVELKLKLRSLDEKRKEALDKILDIKGIIRAFCRIRPILPTDRRQIRVPISTESENVVVTSAGSRKVFGFDKVFHQAASQEDVFTEVKPIIRSAIDGHNVCVLAYGQTGTGKTFTMDGTDDHPGIVPRALNELFLQSSSDHSQSVTFTISMLEIYMGNLRDLLIPKPALRPHEAAMKCNLSVQIDSKGSVEIEGLTEVEIANFAKARWWYGKGRRARSTSWTSVNDASSRSHCLTRVTIFRRGDSAGAKTQVSKLWMIDLGGSERLLKTGAMGQTLDEGRAINLSLSALGDVIAALKRKKGHVPYRNSKLTQVLKDSLGNGSKVLMLVHISPCEKDVGETICSLSFMKRARAVESSSKELSEDLRKLKERRISELEQEIREAEAENQKLKNELQKTLSLLSENRKLFLATYECPDEEKNLKSPREDSKEAVETPRTAEKPMKPNRVIYFTPRFMSSTVASRQRQSASEREILGRVRCFKSAARSSVQFSNSQSLNLSDPRFRALLRSSTARPQVPETRTVPPETPRQSIPDPRTIFLPRTKVVTSSDPNLRTRPSHHRRRMSNLI